MLRLLAPAAKCDEEEIRRLAMSCVTLRLESSGVDSSACSCCMIVANSLSDKDCV